MSPVHRTLQGLLLSTASRWGQALVGLLCLTVLARYLDPHAWGIYASLALLVAVAELFVGPAVSEALLQRTDGRIHHHDAVFCVLGAAAALLTVLLVVAAGPLARLMNVPDQAHLLAALATLLPLAAATGIYQTLLRMQGRDGDLAIVGAIAGTAGSLAGLAAVLADQGLWSLFALEAVRRVALLVSMLYLERWRPQLDEAFSSPDPLFTFNRQVLAERLLGQADQLIPKALVAGLLGTHALGCFVIARRMLDELGELVTAPMRAVAHAAIARSAVDGELLQQVIASLYRTVALTVLPLFIAVAALAPALVPTLFGAGWGDAVILVQVLMLLGFMQSMSGFSELLFKAAGRPGVSVTLFGAGVFTQSVAMIVFASWGSAGVAAAIALRHLLCWPVESMLLRRWLAFGLRAQWQPLRAPLAAAIAMGLATVAFLPLIDSSLSAPMQLLVALPLSLTTYLGVLWFAAPATVRLGLGLTQAALARDRMRLNSLLDVVAG